MRIITRLIENLSNQQSAMSDSRWRHDAADLPLPLTRRPTCELCLGDAEYYAPTRSGHHAYVCERHFRLAAGRTGRRLVILPSASMAQGSGG
jgi:hypothetical protein